MPRKTIEFIEHTGDIGLQVRARTCEDLFILAARGMFRIICPRCAVDSVIRREVAVTGDDIQQLFVNWLSELNFWFSCEGELFAKFAISDMSATALQGVAWGERVDEKKHHLRTEIKAVTYHTLMVGRTEKGWEARVIFDV